LATGRTPSYQKLLQNSAKKVNRLTRCRCNMADRWMCTCAVVSAQCSLLLSLIDRVGSSCCPWFTRNLQYNLSCTLHNLLTPWPTCSRGQLWQCCPTRYMLHTFWLALPTPKLNVDIVDWTQAVLCCSVKMSAWVNNQHSS